LPARPGTLTGVTGPERAARDAVLREIADELAGLVLDDVLPVAHRLRAETARRLGLTMPELACLDTLRRFGPLTSDLLVTRTGLGRSAVSKMVRRLERAGHVERSASRRHVQAVVVGLVPHQERDDELDVLRFRLAAALRGAAGDGGLDRPRRLDAVVLVLHSVSSCLHDVASHAARRRVAKQTRDGKRW
jgi:DNA-binding MarR family transcriptional regulator